MLKYKIKMFAFQSVMSSNKLICYFDYSEVIINEYVNATSPEP